MDSAKEKFNKEVMPWRVYGVQDVEVIHWPGGVSDRSSIDYRAKQRMMIDRWVIGLLEAGEFDVIRDGTRYRITSGDLFIIAPNSRIEHCDDFLDHAFVTLVSFSAYTMATARLADGFLNQLSTTLAFSAWIAPLPLGKQKRFNEILSLLEQFTSTERTSPLTEDKLLATMSLLVFEAGELFLSKAIGQGKSRTKAMLFQKFHALVKKNYLEHHQLDFYADTLCISSKYLSEVTKELIGITASRLVDSFLEREAKRLLLYTNLSVSEIAYQLHYADQSAFGKTFKKFTGKSPRHFRDAQRLW